jgi:HK97 family phage prohead protease
MMIERSVTFEIRSDDANTGDGLTLSGHAAVFNTPTRIDSWEGTFDEQIAPGAFRKTIRERTPVLQFDHGRHPLVGSIPIGRITDLREDGTGLAVEARLSDNWLMEPVRMAIKDKAINGMSFRFEVVREEWRDNAGKLIKPEELMQLLWNPGDRGPLQRTLKEVKVAELGPVVFPAYAATDVSVRAREAIREVYEDKDLLRSIRSSLALGWNVYQTERMNDLTVGVAKALLFDSPVENHQYELGKGFAEALRSYYRESVEVHSVNISGTNGPVMVEEREEVVPVDSDHTTNPEERTEDAPDTNVHPSESEFRTRIESTLRMMRRHVDQALEKGNFSDQEDH